jgi:transcriptional regulator with XRE-family HTH domain
MTTNYLTVGERIKSARMLAGMTQSELAEACGTKQANVSHWENGRGVTSAVADKAFAVLRNASTKAAELLDTYDGVLGIQGRSAGKLGVVVDPMAKPVAKEWIVTDFLARRNVTILAGQEGGGKSMLSQTIAAACITGATECFGFHMPAGRALRVLIIDVENVLMVDDDIDPSIVTERLQAYGMNEDNKHLLTIAGAQGFDMDQDADAIDGILGDAAKNGTPYDVVIMDSFRSLWITGSENTPAAGRVLLKYMRMAHKHDAAVLVLHHQNKAGAAYSGHSSIGSTVSALWTFSKMLVPSGQKGIPATPHPTMRFLAPYKVRISPMAKSRIVRTSAEGITAPLSADEYSALVVDEGTDDTTEGTDNE